MTSATSVVWHLTSNVDGTAHRLVSLTVRVELTVSAANVVVQNGRIAEVRPIGAAASATLAAGGVQLAHGEIADADLAPSPTAVRA